VELLRFSEEVSPPGGLHRTQEKNLLGPTTISLGGLGRRLEGGSLFTHFSPLFAIPWEKTSEIPVPARSREVGLVFALCIQRGETR
jgi:hypothetical protein